MDTTTMDTTTLPTIDLTADRPAPVRFVTDGEGGIPFTEVADAMAQLRVTAAPLAQMVINESGAGYIDVPNYQAVALVNGGHVLNVVSPDYEIHQYGVLVDAAQELVQLADGGVTVQAYGHQNYGGTAWIGLNLTDPVTLPGDDQILAGAFLSSSHDGSWATAARLGSYRMFCRNQLPAFHRSKAVVKIRHTSRSQARLGGIAQVLTSLYLERDALATTGTILANTAAGVDTLRRVLSEIDPRPSGTEDKPVSARAITTWDDRWTAITARFETELATDTAWGVYQAINGYRQHTAPIRTDRDGRTATRVLSGSLATDDYATLTAIGRVLDISALN